MKSIYDIAMEIVAREGGYVNDPDDRGGATNYGVTLATMQRLGIDLTQDGRVTEADLRKLTRARAAEIFVQHYFKETRLDQLPEALQASVFDMYVNAGSNAVRVLQRMLAQMGFDLEADGALGALTIKAAHEAARAAPEHIADSYAIARRNYYYSLGDARPASRKFARARSGGKGGWILRAEAFMSPKYHLTEAAHRARVAAWG